MTRRSTDILFTFLVGGWIAAGLLARWIGGSGPEESAAASNSGGEDERASNGIRYVVMTRWWMGYRILSAAGCTSFKTAELCDHLGMIEQLDLLGVDQRQQVTIEI